MAELNPHEMIEEAKKAYVAIGFLLSKGKSKKHEALRNQCIEFVGNILDDLDVAKADITKQEADYVRRSRG